MDKKSLELIVAEELRERGLRLAIAESCTGGLIGHRITNIPGSSTYFIGGVVAYAYEAKVRLLGVKWSSLEQFGAVSKEVVLEMALGVRRTFAVDIGLSVTGIAGPGGSTPTKPVGYTWVGINSCLGEDARVFTWEKDRLGNKNLSAEAALQLLVDYLRGRISSDKTAKES
jgi:PncC family amidohydrolase